MPWNAAEVTASSSSVAKRSTCPVFPGTLGRSNTNFSTAPPPMPPGFSALHPVPIPPASMRWQTSAAVGFGLHDARASDPTTNKSLRIAHG